MRRVVPGTSCPWGELSMERNDCGASCRGASFDGASCPCGKFRWGELSGNRFFPKLYNELANPAIKATAIKFVSNKPFKENFSANCLIIMNVPAYFVICNVIIQMFSALTQFHECRVVVTDQLQIFLTRSPS
jgi:hypothetical protein